MSATCPKGHTSETTDYCDVCGTPIDPPAPPATPATPATPAPPAAPATAAPPGTSSSSEPASVPEPPPEPGVGAGVCPSCSTENPPGNRFCENCGADMTAPASPPPSAESAGWEAVAVADREVYERMDAPDVAFPLAAPTRRFLLAGERVAIGRRSASRGIFPEIDLSAAPEDAGVSHQHAVLVHQADDSWAVLDPGSANGTYLNDQSEPIVSNQLVALADGDRLHVGAWTTITLHRG